MELFLDVILTIIATFNTVTQAYRRYAVGHITITQAYRRYAVGRIPSSV